MMWVKSVLAKYWILLCCGAFLLVGLQSEVSVYQIGYMVIFLFILICYQVTGLVLSELVEGNGYENRHTSKGRPIVSLLMLKGTTT